MAGGVQVIVAEVVVGSVCSADVKDH